MQDNSVSELQQRMRELEGECEQLLGRAEAAEATVRHLQVMPCPAPLSKVLPIGSVLSQAA